jgi:hypothetical protein
VAIDLARYDLAWPEQFRAEPRSSRVAGELGQRTAISEAAVLAGLPRT